MLFVSKTCKVIKKEYLKENQNTLEKQEGSLQNCCISFGLFVRSCGGMVKVKHLEKPEHYRNI